MYILANTVEQVYDECILEVKSHIVNQSFLTGKHAFHESAHLVTKDPGSFANSIKYNGEIFVYNGRKELYALETRYYNKFIANKTFAPLINILKSDKESKKAYLSLWDNEDKLEEITCLTGFHFYIKDNHLFAVTHMRSNELLRLLPVDIAFGVAVQEYVASSLNLPLGSYTHQVASLVLYTKDVSELL